MLYIFLTLFAAAIVALDQWTKALAAAQLTDVVDVLIPGWLELRYTTNDGMALSMLSGARWLFVVVGVLFTLLHAVIQSYVLTMLTAMFYGEVSQHEPEPEKEPKPVRAQHHSRKDTPQVA